MVCHIGREKCWRCNYWSTELLFRAKTCLTFIAEVVTIRGVHIVWLKALHFKFMHNTCGSLIVLSSLVFMKGSWTLLSSEGLLWTLSLRDDKNSIGSMLLDLVLGALNLQLTCSGILPSCRQCTYWRLVSVRRWWDPRWCIEISLGVVMRWSEMKSVTYWGSDSLYSWLLSVQLLPGRHDDLTWPDGATPSVMVSSALSYRWSIITR